MIEPELGNSECKFSLDLTLGDFGFGILIQACQYFKAVICKVSSRDEGPTASEDCLESDVLHRHCSCGRFVCSNLYSEAGQPNKCWKKGYSLISSFTVKNHPFKYDRFRKRTFFNH